MSDAATLAPHTGHTTKREPMVGSERSQPAQALSSVGTDTTTSAPCFHSHGLLALYTLIGRVVEARRSSNLLLVQAGSSVVKECLPA
jgi:hypothetical protein